MQTSALPSMPWEVMRCLKVKGLREESKFHALASKYGWQKCRFQTRPHYGSTRYMFNPQ